jgi:hypothetical protein
MNIKKNDRSNSGRKKIKIVSARQKLPSQITRKHKAVKLIPWAMTGLACFYLVSLIAVINFFPVLFAIPNSYAQDSTSLGGTTTPTMQPRTYTAPSPTTTADTARTTVPVTTQILNDSTTPVGSSSEPISNTLPTSNSLNITKPIDSNLTTQTYDQTVRAVELSPPLKFLKPANSEILSGNFTIVAGINHAKEISFYLTQRGSLSERYLGKATLASETSAKPQKWQYSVKTKDVPNGEYGLFAKIKNEFGDYKSEAVPIKVSNLIETSIGSSVSTSTERTETSLNTSRESVAVTAENLKEVQKNITDRSAVRPGTANNISGQSVSINALQQETVAGILPKEIDSDMDGISNEEEKRIGTNPNSADSDKDGFLDGDEVKNGFNPLKASEGNKKDRIFFESPKSKGEIKNDLINIEDVRAVVEGDTSQGIAINGKGLPNSFVTVYIYSDFPTIVTVLTDENGNWTYTLDKSLEEGNHEVYVAITDNEGHITAKSSPIAFVKTAQAVSKTDASNASSDNQLLALQSPVKAAGASHLLIVIVIIIVSLSTAVGLIGLFLIYRHHKLKEEAIA